MKTKLPCLAFYTVLALTMIFTLAGCGSPQTPSPTSVPSNTPIPTKLIPAETSTPLPPTITPTPIPSITARGYHQMAYDSDAGLVIVFGGQTGYWLDKKFQSHATWVYDPSANIWEQMKTNKNPGGFAGGDMVYNPKAKCSILSIASDDFTELQTWAYYTEENTWERLADGPINMVGQHLAYDSESDRVIMFGGVEMTDFQLIDETWAYDINTDTWTNMNPATHPNRRNYHGMTYDSKADRVVVWGGDVGGGQDPSVWTYDYNTNTWEELSAENTNPPTHYYYMSFVYDESMDKIVMYGGAGGGNDETWVYDLNTNMWEQMIPATNPGALSRHGMVYATNINSFILFGGQDGANEFIYRADTWAYNLATNTWTNILLGQ